MATQSVSKFGHLKYTLALADLVAGGAVATFDFPLDSLPPGATVYSTTIKASTALVGGGATQNAQVKLGGTLIGAAVAVGTTTGSVNTTPATGSLSAANALAVTVTVTNTLSVLTAGSFDVILNYTVMAP